MSEEKKIENFDHKFENVVHPLLFQAIVKTDLPSNEVKFDKQLLKKIVVELSHHVYQVPLFSEKYCNFLCDFMDDCKRKVDKNEKQNILPNGITRDGIIPKNFGYDILSHVYKSIFRPMILYLFLNESTDLSEDMDGMHYLYMIKYSRLKDKCLKAHIDDSDLTLNICVGKSGFEGSKVCFYENYDSNKATPPPMEQLSTRDPLSSSIKLVEATHQIGYGILHHGNIYHCVSELLRGERYNVIYWTMLKSSNATYEQHEGDTDKGFYEQFVDALKSRNQYFLHSLINITFPNQFFTTFFLTLGKIKYTLSFYYFTILPINKSILQTSISKYQQKLKLSQKFDLS
ncbi:hypothetical protein RFI_24216 [Reticulomyxa filosa]|uniref:Fe2OG dioxygenase domain-containing protein n=1 Tax=Reticulomyxa filosa TaxID=46433 RepID=X6MHK0_RETFI|nr:hypothetical protein RFI_24216 [Reticulomyxa filosa]|eukprot:ETO13156.1 hypothetical protein RFI_24216 [Reticulomyxa filosa]